jgi:hypothetical protein
MKLGFAFKKTKKSGLVAAAAGAENGHVARAFDTVPVKKDEAAERVYVTDFDPNAVAPSAGDDGARRSTLVIPLLKTNEWKAQEVAAEISGDAKSEPAVEGAIEEKEEKEEGTEQLTEDEIAARQLLADVKAQQNGGDGDGRKTSHTLVIPMKTVGNEADPLAEKRAKLFNLDAGTTAPKKSVPILQQNAVPGMDELEDVAEKYRHDVALRPDELDVHSEAYDSVPVEDFGAAMLRGMGWKGTVDEENPDADDPKPRQKLLGLGATAKPKLVGDSGKSARRKEDRTRTNGLNQRDDGRASSKESKRREDEPSRSGRDRDQEEESSRTRSRSRQRDSRKERDRSSRKSDRDGDDRRRDRDRDDRRERDRDDERDRDRDRERDRGRDDRGRRDDRDREKRKRSRSRDRSSDRKKSSSRR